LNTTYNCFGVGSKTFAIFPSIFLGSKKFGKFLNILMVPKHLNGTNSFVTSEESIKKAFVQLLKSTANELTNCIC
jgi:hypothetical protein